MTKKTFRRTDPANFANIPEELRETPQWDCWKLHEGRKVPINPITGRAYPKGTPSDEMGVGTFAQAVAFFAEHKSLMGVGFRFKSHDPFCGIDLDDVRDPETGDLTEHAQELVTEFHDTYREASPSGTGVHLICRGMISKAVTKTDGIEMYCTGRYFTFTGQLQNGSGTLVADMQQQVTALYKRLTVNPALVGDETQARKKTQSNGAGGLVPKGAQDNWLTSRAGGYRRAGDDPATIEKKLLIDYHKRCAPPHDNEQKVREIARGFERYPAGELAATLPLTDGGNADYVEARYPGRIKYQKEGDIWYVADEERRWQHDKKGEVFRLIEVAMREKYEATAGSVDANDKARHHHALNSCNAVKIAHCAQVLRSRQEVAIEPGTFDNDPLLLGVENGILDLHGGKEKLIEGDLSLLVAKRAPAYYEPLATCLRFEKYLERVQPDPGMRDCLAQILGSCLTGIQPETCFIFYLGEGGNGKSTFQRICTDLLGEYAYKCRKQLIFKPDKSSGEQAAGPNDVADCEAARLITASEQKGKHWNEEFIKDFTGGEKQHARQLYGRGYNFISRGKLVIPANTEPAMDEIDEAIRRRFLLLRWDVTVPDEEKTRPFEQYIEWLSEVRSGILNWALTGLASLKKNEWRLSIPVSAKEATRQYLSEQDDVSRFLVATYKDGGAGITVTKIYDNFKTNWLEEEKFVMSRNKFTRCLKQFYGKNRVVRGSGNRMIVFGLAQRTGEEQEEKPQQQELHLGK